MSTVGGAGGGATGRPCPQWERQEVELHLGHIHGCKGQWKEFGDTLG